MKTLAKFENGCAKITYFMATKPEELVTLNGMYFVREEPKSKKSQWIATVKEFSFSTDAKSYFESLISFWLKWGDPLKKLHFAR